MEYSITCPAPCNHKIKVDAQSDDEAVNKLLKEGKAHAKEAHPDMSMSDEEMRVMIRNSMDKAMSRCSTC